MISTCKNYYNNHRLVFKNLAILITILIGIGNIANFIFQTKYLNMYFPTTLFAFLLLFYGMSKRNNNVVNEKK